MGQLGKPWDRTGFRLTEEAELRILRTSDSCCSCHLGCAPCYRCENGLTLEAAYEDDSYWEIDEEVKVSREAIVDRSIQAKDWKIGDIVECIDTTRSSYLKIGVEYKILGFKGDSDIRLDVGHGEYHYKKSMFKLKMSLKTVHLVAPAGCPFKIGDKVVRINSDSGDIKIGDIITIQKLELTFEKWCIVTGIGGDELLYQRHYCDNFKLTTGFIESAAYGQVSINSNEVKGSLQILWPEISTTFKINQQEESNMSNLVNNTTSNRRLVTVKFIDDDAGLDVSNSIVAFYDGMVTQDSDEVTIREVLMNLDVSERIAAHNEVREATVDLDILKRTGNEVFLQPIKLKDLRVEVKTV